MSHGRTEKSTRGVCNDIRSRTLLLSPCHLRQHRFKHWSHQRETLGVNHQIPRRLEFLPPGTVAKMLEAMPECRVITTRPGNRTPGVEFFVCPVVSIFQFSRRKSPGLVDDMPRVIEIPVTRRDTPRCCHFGEKPRAWVRCKNMKRGRGDAVVNRPIDGTTKHVAVVIIESEHEAPVNHDAEVIESS